MTKKLTAPLIAMILWTTGGIFIGNNRYWLSVAIIAGISFESSNDARCSLSKICESLTSVRICPIPRKALARAYLSSSDPPWSRERIRCLSEISSSADRSRSGIVVQSVSRIAALYDLYQAWVTIPGPTRKAVVEYALT